MSSWRSVSGPVEAVALQRGAHLVEPGQPELSPVREVVVAIPAPRYNHREHKNPALLHQLLISARIVRADCFGRVRDVELNRPAATRLQIDEAQPLLGPE